MSKTLRLSETWFRRGLWLVAIVFAGFLIGLGGRIVDDLPRVEVALQLDDFLDATDRARAVALRQRIEQAEQEQRQIAAARSQADLQLNKAQGTVQAERETLANWLATRRATQRADQDPEVIARTRRLEELKQLESLARQAVQAQQQVALDTQQARDAAVAELGRLQDGARQRMVVEQRAVELRVFLYRLALTLPLLVVAGWLFARHRKSTWWPFVWGFIFFALFAFFVELVPYLPSYGGYVRYGVGILVTVLTGRYAILALNRYLERQRQAEAMPDSQRRQELDYDLALARLAKGVCPGCERPVDLKDPAIDFCPHCGICLHDRCTHCEGRKNAFARYCHACGTPRREQGAGSA